MGVIPGIAGRGLEVTDLRLARSVPMAGRDGRSFSGRPLTTGAGAGVGEEEEDWLEEDWGGEGFWGEVEVTVV